MRERDAGCLRARDLGEVKSQAAPAASDIKDIGARIDQELGGKVALLGELRVVKRLVFTFEIGAAVLLVGVKEEAVEPAVEVVVMGYIVPRPRTQIELLQAAKQVAYKVRRQRPFRRSDVLLPQQNREHIRDRALLDDECPVHVGLAQSQLGIEQDGALGFRVGKAHGNRRAAAVAECVSFARGGCDSEGTLADKPPHEYR